jgi:hypothetical protein
MKAAITINQVSKYNNNYYTPKMDLRVLANFLATQLKAYRIDAIQDTKGNLKIDAVYHAVNASQNLHQTFELKDHETEAVVDVIKSKEFPPELVMKKFTLKFAK